MSISNQGMLRLTRAKTLLKFILVVLINEILDFFSGGFVLPYHKLMETEHA